MGTGFQRISAGTILGDTACVMRDPAVGGAGTSALPNPACRTTPRGIGRESPMATPLPNPELTTTPRAPLAPPVPFPEPGPEGRSNEPSWAMVIGFPWLALAGTPLGSPKPPVCTFAAASAVVGVAELPVEKTLVFTGARGITGLGDGGRASNFLTATTTSGAGVSSTLIFGFG